MFKIISYKCLEIIISIRLSKPFTTRFQIFSGLFLYYYLFHVLWDGWWHIFGTGLGLHKEISFLHLMFSLFLICNWQQKCTHFLHRNYFTLGIIELQKSKIFTPSYYTKIISKWYNVTKREYLQCIHIWIFIPVSLWERSYKQSFFPYFCYK